MSDANHTLDDLRVVNTSSQNLLNSNIVDIQFSTLLAHGVEASLGDETTEEIFEAVLLGGNGSLHALENLVVVRELLNSVANLLIQEFMAVVGCLLITDEDLRWMETHLEEALGLSHKLSSEADNEVGSISTLILLHLGGLSDHFGGRVKNITLLDDGSGIRGDKKFVQMVDHHLVHT